MEQAWCIASFLYVHFEGDEVDYDLGMALRLHVAAHNAKADPWFATPCDEGWYYCVERSFTRGIYIVVAFA
jgi:hypothetical protein